MIRSRHGTPGATRPRTAHPRCAQRNPAALAHRLGHDRIGLAAGVIADAAVAGLDVLSGPGHSYMSSLGLGPLIAATVASGRRPVVAVTALSLALTAPLAMYDGAALPPSIVLKAGFVLVAGVIAILLVNERTRLGARMTRVEDVAAAAQTALVPVPPRRLAQVDLACRYASAAEEALIGGDFVAALDTPFGARAVLGDARGHGVGAMGYSAGILAGFRERAGCEHGLADLAAALERRAQQLGLDGDFASAVLVEIRGSSLVLVNCGHPDPLLLREGHVVPLEPARRSPPLGVGSSPVETRYPLRPGDRVLLYSDGVAEARDRRGGFLDLADACSRLLGNAPLEEGVEDLMALVRRHAGGRLADDVSLLALELVAGRASVPSTATPRGRAPVRTCTASRAGRAGR